MKRIITILLAALILFPAVYTPLRQISVYAADSDLEKGDDEETPEPTASPSTDTEEEPQATEPPVTESYTGEENPEDDREEIKMTGASDDGKAGAAGGLGFDGRGFPDCRGHWAEEIIIDSAEKKYLDGYDDGNFYPDNPVTASEFSKIFCAWRGSFYQITSGYWATPYIIKTLNDGIFEKGEYADYDIPMTREQVAKAVIRSLPAEQLPEHIEEYEGLIDDMSDAGEGFKEYILEAYVLGVMTGYEDGTLRPKGNVTRAEILSIISRAVDTDQREIPSDVAEVTKRLVESGEYASDNTTVRILAESAIVEGGMLNKFGTGEDSYIENFRTEQKIIFNFKAALEGRYKMTIYYSANVNSGGGTVTFDLNGSKFDHEFAQTGGWAYYVYEELGEFDLKQGNNTLILTDKEIPNTYLINVKNIVFEKID